MKIKLVAKKILAAVLSAAVVMGASGSLSPVLEVLADFVIDGSGFDDVKITSQTVYLWEAGKPPVEDPLRDVHSESTQGITGYPTLICFGGRYLAAMTQEGYGTPFATALNDADDVYKRANMKGNPGDWEDYDDEMVKHPSGWYAYSRCIGTGPLLRDLPLDADALVSTGHAISMSMPKGIPVLYSVGKQASEKLWTRRTDVRWSGSMDSTEMDSFYAIQIATTKYDGTGDPQWLIGKLRRFTYVSENIFGWDINHENSFDWLVQRHQEWSPLDIVADKTLTYHYISENGNKAKKDRNPEPRSMQVGLVNRTWEIRENIGVPGTYTISTQGINENMIRRISGSAGYGKYLTDPAGWNANITLTHLTVAGTSMLYMTGNMPFVVHGQPGSTNFQLFYATPTTMNFIRSNVTVQKGQVVNLVGPLALDKNVTITVQDGGVLTVTGWVLNNGKIKVEQGGTLLVQKAEKTNTVLSALLNVTDANGGAIACDGTMIVMSGCTVNANGNYGLQFGEGAQCVNYGAIVTENLNVYTDHTIENRGGSSCLVTGKTILDGGYSLMFDTVRNASYPTLGTRAATQKVTVPANYVYGPGAYRTYNSASTSVSGNKSGKVCDVVN